MAVVTMVVHPERDEAAALAREAIGWLHERGHEVRMPANDAVAVGHPEFGVPDDELGLGSVLAVSLGGDGTVLRTVELVSAHGVPILSVNCGQLGYLTEVDAPSLEDALGKFFAGAHVLDERMMLEVTFTGTGERSYALNEVVLERTLMGHTVRLAVSIDGEPWTTYVADALILATPTGSTAYSLSARGPVLSPELRALVLTPVSPHPVFDRSMVFLPDTVIRLTAVGERPATVSIDGRNIGALADGESVECTSAPHNAHLVSFGTRDFHRILKTKFGLSDR